ncbi:MAG: electron transport complex subunit RsxA [Candidatus Omnitrophica bacterium]|jgi:electron transport complex protein RnfA|nr:electron transport complex subunit RsxA [Candidatus Omnitrophota bacterium]MCF7892493.1 electron transport complex subunit RsxA [Candidatus Omnitrophota bacterium]MCF7896144.1 electron transport complex subunit RsxA [Candidatus Omnitrophota bacterium]MCF7898297.1 electron transport complex subunit RsxA [Candidatus Omnitrophota bacterium]MCF7910015.1 electron transport complex subunit RsxA [Candidatus Omnitrophota bacterium]
MENLILIFISTILINNVVLTYFLGICPFLGVSGKMESALGMGMAVTFVMTLATSISWLIYYLVLERFGLTFLEYVVFILIIASLVQIVEMFIKKYSKNLYQSLGIYLPLITSNCAILGVALFMIVKEYSFLESVVFGFSGGLGFSLVLMVMAGIREELDFADIPETFKGAPLTLITAGILALIFMGFSGLGGG